MKFPHKHGAQVGQSNGLVRAGSLMPAGGSEWAWRARQIDPKRTELIGSAKKKKKSDAARNFRFSGRALETGEKGSGRRARGE